MKEIEEKKKEFDENVDKIVPANLIWKQWRNQDKKVGEAER